MEPYHDFGGTNPEKTLAAAAAILAPIFTMNGWRWAGASAKSGVPNEKEIFDTLSTLLSNLSDPDVVSSATGRLCVRKDICDGGTINVSLELGSIYPLKDPS